MQKRVLFQQLCAVADAIEAACAELDCSPVTRALEAIVERLDGLIGTLLDEGVHDDGAPPRRPGESRWVLPLRPEDDAPAPVPLSLAQWRVRDREEASMNDPERLLARIQACVGAALRNQLPLPCRIDEMTPREYQISLALSAALGALTTIADWTRAALEDAHG